MIRRPPRSTQSRSSAASDVYKRQLHGTGVLGADEGDDLPQIVRGLDDPTEGRHRSDNNFRADPLVTLLLEIVAAKSDQPENCVVVGAIDPGVVGERRTHTAAAAAAVAAVAAKGQVFLAPYLGHRIDIVVIGVVQATDRRLLYELERRGLVVFLAAVLSHRRPSKQAHAANENSGQYSGDKCAHDFCFLTLVMILGR